MRPFIATVATILVTVLASSSLAIDAPVLMRESAGSAGPSLAQGCPLEPNLTGDCANLRYYNLCSGYLWIYTGLANGEAVGVCFDDSCVSVGRGLDKAITYFRNVGPGYNNTMDVLVDVDFDSDCCSDYTLASDLALDPGLRWNCSALDGQCVPSGTTALIVKTVQGPGSAPTIATDGPFSSACDPVGLPHSYYYGFDDSNCTPWNEISPTGRNDNLLYWLIVDRECATTSDEATSWGQVKALFH